MFCFREPLLHLGLKRLDRDVGDRGNANLLDVGQCQLLHRRAIAVKQFQDGVERRDLRQFGLRLDQGGNLLQAIHHLRIHRMLDPQRAVLIKRGNALLGRHELRAALSCSRLDEFYDGLFGRAVVPRSQRVCGLRGGRHENDHAGECNCHEVLPARRSVHDGGCAFGFQCCLLSLLASVAGVPPGKKRVRHGILFTDAYNAARVPGI